MSMIVSEFVDGLIGFFYAREHRSDEQEWTQVGLKAIESFRKWERSSEWNFTNKLFLLEAEFYFLRGVDEQAMDCYKASIKSAREHRFVHEEGLANAAAAKCCLHYGKKKKAMIYYAQAKDCYGRWGANALVSRIEEICRKL